MARSEHAFVHTIDFGCSNIPRRHVRGSVGQGSRTLRSCARCCRQRT